MKLSGKVLFLVLLAGASHAQPPPGTDDPIVQLPPLIVEESRKAAVRPWLYTEAAGFEVLSRCSESTTIDFARAYYHATQIFQVLVPPALQVKMSCAASLLLYRSDMVRQLPPELVAEMTRLNPTSGPDFLRARIVPNLTLRDVDLNATYTVIDDRSFEGSAMRIAPEAVRHSLEARTPTLPRWFIEGIASLYGGARFESNSIELPALFWVTTSETKMLRADRDHPRSLLPLNELFKERVHASDLPPDTLVYPWRNQAALFIRWALDGKKRSRREALFRFVAQASEAPATEAMFQECIGLDYADVHDRLSDYLPQAVDHSLPVPAEKSIPRLKLNVRAATVAEVARVKGDWERLSVRYVRDQYPALATKYLEQSRLTLLHAYDQGERDPCLMAAIGLSYCDAGEDKAARPFLEAAVTGGAIRPRAYFELARLRYVNDLPPTGGNFNAAQTGEILQPLRHARDLSPPMPATYDLAARVLFRADRAPTSDELAWIAEGAQFFPLSLFLTYEAAEIYVRYGTKSAASVLIDRGRAIAGDDEMRHRFERLSAALAHRPD